jgi:hypothetical protein
MPLASSGITAFRHLQHRRNDRKSPASEKHKEKRKRWQRILSRRKLGGKYRESTVK